MVKSCHHPEPQKIPPPEKIPVQHSGGTLAVGNRRMSGHRPQPQEAQWVLAGTGVKTDQVPLLYHGRDQYEQNLVADQRKKHGDSGRASLRWWPEAVWGG